MTHVQRSKPPETCARWPRIAQAAGAGLVLLVCAALLFAAAEEEAPAPAVEAPGLQAPDLRAVGIPQVLLLAAFAAAVFYVANWTFLDVRLVKTSRGVWSGLVLAGGLAGLAVAILIPLFYVGLPLGVILFAGAAVSYCVHRNGLVSENLTVLSRAHLARLKGRLGGRRAEIAESGPVVGTGRDIIFVGLDDLPIRLPTQSEEERLAAWELERIFFEAVVRRATVVGLLVRGGKAQVRWRIAGQVVDGGELVRPISDLVASRIKQIAGLNPAETRRPQEGRLRIVVAGQTFELRVKSQGSVRGEQIAVRVIDLAASEMGPKDLGLSESQLETLTEALAKRPGLVLLSAPKNSGLTTTLHACLRHFDRYINSCLVFEPHVRLEVDNVQHVVLNQEDGSAAAEQVRSHLRTGPDVVAVDSLSAPEVAEALAAFTMEHTVLIGLRAGDAGEALAHLISLLPSTGALAGSLQLVANQRLVRELCPACKEAYRPNPDFLRKANLASRRVEVLFRPPQPAKTQQGKAVLCPRCGNLRYVGRAGLFELMPIDDEARDMIARGVGPADVRTHARKGGMQNLQEEGLELVIAGRTSVEEVLRAIKQTK